MKQLLKKIKSIDRHTILFKLVIAISILMIAQMSVVGGTVVFGSTFKTLNDRTINSFQSNLDMQKAYIESDMINQWGNIGSDYANVTSTITTYIQSNQVDVDTILNSGEQSTEVLKKVSDHIFNLLRKNKVNGAFFILNNTSNEKYGLYFRDTNPTSISYDNGDVLIEVCPVEMKKNLDISHLDTSPYYETQFHFTDENGAFYNKAIVAGQSPFINDVSGLGYWYGHFNVHGFDSISYQIPVKINEKTIGVLGIEVDKRLFMENLQVSIDEISNISVVRIQDNQVDTICESYIDSDFEINSLNELQPTSYKNVYSLKAEDNDKLVVASDINLYTSSAYYADERWAVLGINNESDIYGSQHEIIRHLLRIIFVTLLLGLIGAVILAKYLVKPIVNTSRSVSSGSILDLDHTGTKEVDVLIDELKKSVTKVYALPMRLSRILNLAHVDMAAFEYISESNTVSVTDKFYELLGLEDIGMELPVEQFKQLLQCLDKDELRIEDQSEVFYIRKLNRWVRIKYLDKDDETSGVVRDVTNEMNSRRMIEKERDFDVLTGLLNRRGFKSAMDKLWDEEGEALLLMMDLDNLKFINDKYGHDFGDDYIASVANKIKKYNSHHVLTCHLSGDEFIIYAHGFSARDDIKQLMNELNKDIRTAYIDLYGEKFYARMSCGMAFKEVGDDYDYLLKKAEFAMYEIKNASKNDSSYFSQERYLNNEMRIGVFDRFNNMLSSGNMYYVFQPIVNLHSGEVLGYEALMRSNVQEFSSPLKIIELAKEVNRLKEIESFTFFEAIKTFNLKQKDTKTLLFINSLSNQVLTSEQFNILQMHYQDILSRVVVEICEEESQNEKVMQDKLHLISQAGSELAIDDYGTGYNNLATILEYNAKYVKIEGSLVRGIDQDEKKYSLAKSIIDYCKQYGIHVIAECVETTSELQILHGLGVDYVQGYYLQKPDRDIKPLPIEVVKTIQKLNQ